MSIVMIGNIFIDDDAYEDASSSIRSLRSLSRYLISLKISNQAYQYSTIYYFFYAAKTSVGTIFHCF
jgi:hypothetical protein